MRVNCRINFKHRITSGAAEAAVHLCARRINIEIRIGSWVDV
jgi:hypothetical protein